MATLTGTALALVWKEEHLLLDQFHLAGKFFGTRGEQLRTELPPPDGWRENDILGKQKGLEGAASLMVTLATAALALL